MNKRSKHRKFCNTTKQQTAPFFFNCALYGVLSTENNHMIYTNATVE